MAEVDLRALRERKFKAAVIRAKVEIIREREVVTRRGRTTLRVTPSQHSVEHKGFI